MTSRRETCLNTAKEYVTRDRASTYGSAEDNFSNIAELWNAQGLRIDGRALGATDVALLMVGMKLARLRFNPTHDDSWIDVAGYAACGMDVAFKPADDSALAELREALTTPQEGWAGDMYRCGTMLAHGVPVEGHVGPKPHAAHSYGRDNGSWCDGYI